MNKVITINLGGNAYQLEEDGYNALRTYLENAAARLQANPDRDEILLDIERAIAEKFRALLASHKTVVETKEVAAVIAEMGPIDADADTNSDAHTKDTAGSTNKQKTEERTGDSYWPHRRLYRIDEGAMLAGVCNGIGAYVGVDPTLIRLAFVFLAVVWGTGIFVYIVLALVIPEARSSEEKAAASGSPFTAQEFIRRAKEGYYEATKGFPDGKARREWHRRFKREMRMHASQWRYNWYKHWREHAPVHPGMGFTLPVLSVLQGAATVVWICALISLLATGMIFGIALPSNVPVWAAAIILLIAYGIIIGPLKMARRLYYWNLSGTKAVGSFVFLVDALVWMIVVATLLLLAFRYFPELHQAVSGFPTVLHQGISDVKTWWKGP
jgi:phage shock protein PspC (stress-responsive transcriptional regulator)